MVKKEEGKPEEKKKKELWAVQLVITNEEQPPKKVFTKGEETLDLYAAIAKLLNQQEILVEGMLS